MTSNTPRIRKNIVVTIIQKFNDDKITSGRGAKAGHQRKLEPKKRAQNCNEDKENSTKGSLQH